MHNRIRLLLVLFCSILLTLPVFSQKANNKEQNYALNKGRHHASGLLKNRIFCHIEDLHWHSAFDSSARYFIRNKEGKIDIDQYDWSKLSGITFSPLRTLRNTAMVGWRYNIEKDSIELIPYFHVSGQRLFNDEPHLTVGINEPFDYEIHLNYYKKEISVTIYTASNRLSEKKAFRTFRPWVVQIHPFFGGNKRAPRKINIHFHLEKTKRTRKK